METLFAIGMLVGMAKPHAELPRPTAPLAEHVANERTPAQRGTDRRRASADSATVGSRAEWPLGF